LRRKQPNILKTRGIYDGWLPRATAAAWAPDGAGLAVVLPPGWRADAPEQEPIFTTSGPGELWLWSTPGRPDRQLAAGLDFASPVLWLPTPALGAALTPASPSTFASSASTYKGVGSTAWLE
jgi:hypothetical protein